MAATGRNRNRARILRVGALILLGAAVIALAVWQVGKIFDVFASRYPLVTIVDNAAGLREGAPVTLAGQRVGQVAAIEFIPLERQTDEQHVRVHLSVSQDVRKQIRGDSRAYIRTQGLLGDKYVDISPGTPRQPVLLDGDTLPSAEIVDLETVMEQASTMMDSASAIIGDIHAITRSIATGQGTMGRLLTDDALYLRLTAATGELASLLRDVDRSNGTLGRLMKDPSLYDDAARAIARVDTLTGDILQGRGTLGRFVTDDALYERSVGTVTKLDSTLASVNTLLDQVNTGDGTLQRLISDPALYEQILKSVVDLQTLIQDMRENPKKYVPDVHVKVF